MSANGPWGSVDRPLPWMSSPMVALASSLRASRVMLGSAREVSPNRQSSRPVWSGPAAFLAASQRAVPGDIILLLVYSP